ncbi:uncharacterized protein G2W53_017698 [Senna tora]|uniref:Reverse transcriptase domain-containing protein n=1 Tax=Senna tora TaxID=362788 RepID=A0A834WR07_9FABA|nr:uncharacterized protein G2W53_017698 [Senna tora]
MDLRMDLEDKLKREEILWAQKARQLWLVQGDRNTKYFHTVVRKRRVHNHFTRLKKPDGKWTKDYTEMEPMALQYFKNVYAYDQKPQMVEIFHQLYLLDIPHLNVHEIQIISSPVTDFEIENALFHAKPDKAPGPDGLPTMFFQRFWPVVKDSLVQSEKVKSKWCAYKLDIHKAYDKISWDFLEAVLIKMGFPDNIIQIIMQIVSTVSYTSMLNGQYVGFFQPQRGVRQGDPLSPYIFLLCSNILSGMLNKLEKEKKLQGIPFGRGDPAITHLMYADDTILFFKARMEECSMVKQLLDSYAMLAG